MSYQASRRGAQGSDFLFEAREAYCDHGPNAPKSTRDATSRHGRATPDRRRCQHGRRRRPLRARAFAILPWCCAGTKSPAPKWRGWRSRSNSPTARRRHPHLAHRARRRPVPGSRKARACASASITIWAARRSRQLKFSQGAHAQKPRQPPLKPAGLLPPADPSRRYQGPKGLAKALQALAKRRS